MKINNIHNLNIKINEDISEDMLNMKLTDMYCKHVIRRNQDGMQIKAGKLYIESCKLGYKVCNWGLHVGHASDIQYHIASIVQMERDGYNPAIRIVICKYDFCDTPIVWIDNLHSAIKYIRQYGKDVKLRDIPFYVVDISDYEHPSINGHNGSLRENYEDILGAAACAYKRFRRSNSKELIEIGYTLRDFLYDNPTLYTELNVHLDLTNASDDVETILDKSAAFNSLYNTEEYLYRESEEPRAYYVDHYDETFGRKEETELAVRLAEVYIGIQECTDGYDYTIYDGNYTERDGGVYDNPDISIREALEEVLTDIKMNPEYQTTSDTEITEMEYSDLMNKVNQVQVVKSYNRMTHLTRRK